MTDSLSPEERQQLTLLFDRAADLSASERASFVERECGANAALRDELARLLGTLDGDDVVERLRSGPALSEGARTGTDVGPYRLLERIGMGGMGEVYAASQTEPVRRRVALKVIKPGMDSAQVVARFEAERQALARMSHTHVAQIFDGGVTSDGRPYFVMEHVAGDPITDYCDRHKLSTHERLELFISVCAGVQHAHQKGLIHRDLKPSNLLVTVRDGKAIPKIIDFGIARATTGSLSERTLHTMVGQVMGTLEYMSPEQADPTALDVDTRSDVYSLGVVLYELVSGLLPFEYASADRPLSEIQRAIRELDPPTPSTRLKGQTDATKAIALLHGTDPRVLARQLAGDLDWICLKALEKDPARRYASPSELADDVRRHLSHEPVLAGKPGVLYRARKYVRRNRLGVTAGVLVAGAGVMGIFGIISGRIEAEQSAEEATRNFELAEERRKLAEASEQRAEENARLARDETAKVLRLSDVKVLQELEAEAEGLWPAYPEQIPALGSWMERASALVARLPGHRATLAEMRSGALGWRAEERARDRATHPRAAELEDKQSELEKLIAQLDQGGLSGDALEAADARAEGLEAEVAALVTQVESRQSWSFDTPAQEWQHNVLTELVEGLEGLEAGLLSEDAILLDLGWSVGKRLAFARELESGFAAGGEHAEAWAAALPAIREAYPGLDFTPQMGLLPIGPDHDSGLWEFAHLMTGKPAQRDVEGRLILTEAMGVVLVLIPGGTFWMGAQSDDPNARNYDRLARSYEGPVHEVELSTFMLSKYELTQAQWLRLAGRNPSEFQPPDSRAPSMLHPVETISWLDCMAWLPRAGLALPSEAQWESGARGGTDGSWWTGPDRESLKEQHAANIADQAAARAGYPWGNIKNWPELDDGYAIHAPVGTFSANAFGLHEVAGNLWERCQDGYDAEFYGRNSHADPVAPWDGAYKHVSRGGGFNSAANLARSATRFSGSPSFAGAPLGVRPARVITD